MTYHPDKSQEWALLTWYKEDNPLHKDARHPAIGLAGEAGELLNLYKKSEYKPGYNFDKNEFLLELSDYSYYLRILAYQKEVSFEELCKPYSEVNNKLFYSNVDLLELLSDLYSVSGKVLSRYLETNNIWTGKLTDCALYFLAILDNLDIKLQTVLDLNYKKLNSEPSNHGWHNA